ncbi:MAG: tetratricopeptide repeat protein [Myxococcota bacterium]|nr:tetratricopeptide repeat protein [Myxococcota bacterium]
MSAALIFITAASASWTCSRSSQRAINHAVEALEAGDPVQAEVMYRKALDGEPDCGLAGHGLGVSLMRQDRPAEALALLTGLAAAWPEEPEVLTALSVAAFAAQDFSTARTAALLAIGQDSSSLEATAALLAVLLRQGEQPLAMQVVEDARGKLAGPSLACLEAQVLVEGGQVEAARGLLSYCRQSPERALVAAVSGQLAPGSTAALADEVGAAAVAGITEALGALNAGDPATARSILDGVLTASPDRIDARILRARCHRALGDLAAAQTDLESAFEGETWIEVHASGAMSGILLKSHEVQLNTLLADGIGLLVDILIASGDLDGARQALSTATGALGSGPHLAAAEARLLMAAGDAEEAWRRLGLALSTWMDEAVLLTVAGEWGLAEPSALPETAAAALARSPRWADRYNLAAIRYQSGQHAECVSQVRAATNTLSLDDAARTQLWGLGYRCAAQSQDLSATDEAARFAGPMDRLDPVARVNHALMRYSAGAGHDALAPLAGLSGPPQVTVMAATIAVRVYGEAEEWSEALAAAKEAPAAERYWLGKRLVNDGALADGISVLSAACPGLSGAERVACTDLLVQLGRTP